MRNNPAMNHTSASLLDRLRLDSDPESWQRMVEIYTPLIHNWLSRHGLQEQDRNDIVQEVLTVVMRRLPDFEHNQRVGAFRAWLRTITVNCLRDFWKAQRIRPKATGDTDFLQIMNQMEDPESALSQLWDREHDLHVTQKLLELIKPQFAENTWLAFQGVTLEGRKADEVAAELQITINAVYIARSRVLAQLRQEAMGLLE